MAEVKETVREYYIPDNFIEEGRILQGKFKLKNVIEGAVMAALFSTIGILIILFFPTIPLELKVTIVSLFCVPPFALGVIGFNGDTLFTAIKSASAWIKNRETMLYNTNPRLLKRDPLMTIINEFSARDKLIEDIESRRQENIRKKAELDMSEGKDFVFAKDEHVDIYTKRLRKSVAETKGKKEQEYLIDTGNSNRGYEGRLTYDPDEELVVDNDISPEESIGTISRYGTDLSLTDPNEENFVIEIDEC